MKTLFSAVCLLWLLSCATTHTTTTSTSKRQPLRQQPKTTDTVQLLYTTFVKNRQKYVNRPFSLLLEDLPLGVNEYFALHSEDSKGDSKPKGVYLHFTTIKQLRIESSANPGNKGLKVLVVEFTTFPPEDSVLYMEKKNKYKWSKEEAAYYANYLVADVGVPGIHE